MNCGQLDESQFDFIKDLRLIKDLWWTVGWWELSGFHRRSLINQRSLMNCGTYVGSRLDWCSGIQGLFGNLLAHVYILGSLLEAWSVTLLSDTLWRLGNHPRRPTKDLCWAMERRLKMPYDLVAPDRAVMEMPTVMHLVETISANIDTLWDARGSTWRGLFWLDFGVSHVFGARRLDFALYRLWKPLWGPLCWTVMVLKL